MGESTRTAGIQAECLLFIILASITTLLRIISRTQSKAGLWWDDYLSIVALVLVIALNSLGYAEARHGLGRHIEAAGPNGALFYLRGLYVDGLVYNVCLTLVKISVLCFYQRVFSTTKRTRQLLRITGGIVLAWCISVVVTCLLGCLPIKSAWTPTLKGKCIDFLQFYYGSAGSSIVLDFILLVTPVPFLWRLHMDWSHKIALLTTFLLGYLNPIVSFVRLAYLIKLGPKISGQDITWNYVDLTEWSTAECSVALISAHIPSLQFLFTRFIKELQQSNTKAVMDGGHLSSDGTRLVTKRGITRHDGGFQRLEGSRIALGFNQTPHQYRVSASTKNHAVAADDLELDHSNTRVPQIHVSKRIDVVSSQSRGDGSFGVENV